MPAEPERVEALFNTPTVEETPQLAPKAFERFVALGAVLARQGTTPLVMLLTGKRAMA